MAKSAKKARGTGNNGGRAMAPGMPRAAGSAQPEGLAWKTGWICLHLLVLLVPIAMSNATWLGFQIPFTYDQFDIAKVFVQRLFTLVALGAWSWHMLTKGGPLRRTRVDYFILVLLAWIALTTVTSIAPAIAVFGKYRRFEGLVSFVNYATIFFLVTQYADRASRIKSLLRTLFFAGVIVNGYGVLQYLGLDPVKWGSLPFEANRAFSTYGNPDLLGGFIVFSMTITIGLALSERDATWRTIYWFGLLLAAADWIVAFTRGAWVGGIVALVILGFVFVRHRIKLTGTDYGFLGFAAAIATALVYRSLSATSEVMNAVKRFTSILDFNDPSSQTRFEIWQAAIDSIKDRPILGYGADTFRLVYPRYKTYDYVAKAGYLSVADNVHNYPLQITSALGIPGFLLLYGFFGTVAYMTAPLVFGKREDTERFLFASMWAACAGYLVNMLFGISVTGVTFILWVLMALLFSPIARTVQVRPPRWGVPAAAVVVLVVVALLIGNVVYVVADNSYLKGRVASEGVERVAYIQNAIQLNPYNDMYRAELGLAYTDMFFAMAPQIRALRDAGQDVDAARAQAQMDFDSAEAAFLDAIAWVPWEYDNYVFLANLYVTGAQALKPAYAQDAVRVGLQGVEVEPYGPAVRVQLTNAYILMDDPASALPHIELAADLDPNYFEAAALHAEVLAALGRIDEARAEYERALALNPASTEIQAALAALDESPAAE